jgi:hypothetical protein
VTKGRLLLAKDDVSLALETSLSGGLMRAISGHHV